MRGAGRPSSGSTARSCLCAVPCAKPRFRFEAFWVKLDGFEHVVRQAWDYKLRKTAKALKIQSMQNIGSERSQLFMAGELIA
jgi:hypothetical protein